MREISDCSLRGRAVSCLMSAMLASRPKSAAQRNDAMAHWPTSYLSAGPFHSQYRTGILPAPNFSREPPLLLLGLSCMRDSAPESMA